MTRSAWRRLLTVVAALLVSRAAAAQPPIAWWKTDATMKELALTADQSARIESIFQASMVDLRREKTDLDTVEGKLSHLIEINADEGRVTREIDRAETARAALNKTRTLMLLHMRQILTADQRTKLNAMRDRWGREQRDRPRAPDQISKPDNRKELE
jgi:Spy/CpxP family protein refolding chaperone